MQPLHGPVENAARVAPPPDAPSVKLDKHSAEYMRQKAEEDKTAAGAAKKAAEDAKKLAKLDMSIEFMTGKEQPLPAHI